MKKKISKILIILSLITGTLFWNSAFAEPLQPGLYLYVNTESTSVSVPHNGSVQISWRSVNATSCIATGGSSEWPGDRGVGGDFITGPLIATTTFSMTCSGGLGTTPVTKSATVSITPVSRRGAYTTPSTPSETNLSVFTDDAYNISYTTAILQGHRDLSSSSGLPTTAYFRYSKASIPPIFCNDIYGTNMVSTGDIFLDTTGSDSFYQPISNLTPDTTYYYCAIISDRENIVYGGSSIVKSFHTSPYQTTVRTSGATSISSESAVLNGTVSSIDNVTTYFQYKITPTSEISANWESDKLCETTHTKVSGTANIYQKISCNFSKLPKKYTEEGGLIPNTKYQFRAVAVNSSGVETKTTYGTTLNFTTSPTGTGNGDRDVGGVGTGPTNPNSITRSCPSGWTGTYPNCTGSSRTGTCPSGWTGTYPNCTGSSRTGTCPSGWTGTYPNCIGIVFNPNDNSRPTSGSSSRNVSSNFSNPNNGLWNSSSGGKSGNWGTGISSGTWIADTGTGGTGTVTWVSTGNGRGTWRSATGSGTWISNTGTGGTGTGTLTNLTLGQVSTPPNDAIVRYLEGIETVFTRQIMANEIFTKTYGYQEGTSLENFAWYLSDQFARMFGYVNDSGKEIRVSFPDIAAYQLQLIGNQLTVYEYYDNQIVDVRNFTTAFKDASDYEYYFKK